MRYTRPLLGLFAVACSLSGLALAQINLGAAIPYGIIANTAITNTGATVVNGRIALVNDATSITGFPPGLSSGVDAGNAAAGLARQDAQTAYDAAAGQIPTSQSGSELGGLFLVRGTYAIASSASITGTLVLDGGNDANSQFIFQIGSTLTTSAAASVVLVNGAQACNVFWQVSSSATLGTDTALSGNIIALTSISLRAGVNVDGGLYALNGAVTLIGDVVTAQQDCLRQGLPPPAYLTTTSAVESTSLTTGSIMTSTSEAYPKDETTTSVPSSGGGVTGTASTTSTSAEDCVHAGAGIDNNDNDNNDSRFFERSLRPDTSVERNNTRVKRNIIWWSCV
ncbi:unnamed protein product [Zymoseptoria tritici ST99CH_1E4]|uniref:DUF3494 domain-containing protein n=2 Tax=Zymoseptoria tritici TaxID=1047171 RepID=A0A2H1GI11_ZYMTR|nr:unnamed protein product [Zymoseptoria tritici ST99CH_1E4]